MTAVSVYTDGACLRNPGGPGGYAAVALLTDGRALQTGGSEPQTTNNRMELRAAIEGMSLLSPHESVVVLSDSQYVVKGFTRLAGWKRRGWRTQSGGPVKNRDLWEAVEREAARHASVAFEWVRGHAGNRWNEYVDEMAHRLALEEADAALAAGTL